MGVARTRRTIAGAVMRCPVRALHGFTSRSSVGTEKRWCCSGEYSGRLRVLDFLALAEITLSAQGLKFFQDCLPLLRYRYDVVNVQGTTMVRCGATSTSDALEVIALEHIIPQAEWNSALIARGNT